jgi:hypothetical protein
MTRNIGLALALLGLMLAAPSANAQRDNLVCNEGKNPGSFYIDPQAGTVTGTFGTGQRVTYKASVTDRIAYWRANGRSHFVEFESGRYIVIGSREGEVVLDCHRALFFERD